MKKSIKRILALVLSLVMVLSLVACGGGDTTIDENKEDEGNEEIEVPEGRILVEYWSTWGSNNKAYLDEAITAFNNSQDTYYAVQVYVGGAGDLYAKLQVTDVAKRPALINTTTEWPGAYLYTDYIVPVYEIAGTADQEYLDQAYPNLCATWADTDGNLLGYPMGNSMSGVYFNMNIMEQAGIDPVTDYKTFYDLYDICKKLMDGGYCTNKAIGFEHTIRFLSYTISQEGLYAYNNEAGMTGIPTESYYNTGEVGDVVSEFFQLYKKFQDDGLCFTEGASWGDELLPAVTTGDIAILTGTIGGYGRVERAWNEAHPDEPANFLFLPWASLKNEDADQPASGQGWYIIDNGNADAAQGAWEFIKFFSTADNGNYYGGWCALTGYLPISDISFNSTTYQEYVASHPNLGLDNLMEVQRTDGGTVYHPISAVYTQTSSIGLSKYNAYRDGGDLKTLLAEYEAEINDALSMWAMANS